MFHKMKNLNWFKKKFKKNSSDTISEFRVISASCIQDCFARAEVGR